ncbi:MAG TPA: cache domain-containing protein, partial [Longimicrobiales bacterium]|nr:cache domain-containing protein [Longimicrobiales bacterium]
MTPTLSIRSSLFALAAVIVLPLVGLGAFSIYSDFRTGSARAEEDAMARARAASEDLEQLVGDNEEVLGVLARWYAREEPDPEICARHLVESSAILSRFYTLSVVDRDGRLLCASRPVGTDTPASLADRRWLRDVVASGSFVVSKPVQGRYSGEWISVFAHPIRDAEGAVTGAMVGSVDVHTFQAEFDDVLLPPGSVITLAHADGTVVARSEDPDRYVGTMLPDGELSEEQLLGGVGFNRTRGIEGIERLWAWSPISGVEWVVFAGIPTE